jgi:hypothetical protein
VKKRGENRRHDYAGEIVCTRVSRDRVVLSRKPDVQRPHQGRTLNLVKVSLQAIG